METFYTRENVSVTIATYPPQVRTIVFNNYSTDTFYRLSFPHIAFIGIADTNRDNYYLYMGFSPTPLVKNGNLLTKVPLFYPPLPNIDFNNRVCLPYYNILAEPKDCLQAAITCFWNTSFSAEGFHAIEKYMRGNESMNEIEFLMDFFRDWQNGKIPTLFPSPFSFYYYLSL